MVYCGDIGIEDFVVVFLIVFMRSESVGKGMFKLEYEVVVVVYGWVGIGELDVGSECGV